MNQFIQKYDRLVTGVLTGFDRLVFRGTLRPLAVAGGMFDFLCRMGVLLKDFGAYVERTTTRLKAASCEEARRLERPLPYLYSSRISKEAKARQIAEADDITEGLICVLSCVEPCLSYEIYRDRERKKLVLKPRHRKCLHLYHYWIDPVFGFMSGRIQTWFPLTIQVCLNGREWLARQMDRRGLDHERRENCFPWLADPVRAQALMDEQLRTDWPTVLTRIARQLNPAHEEIFDRYRVDYYWSTHQSEWATDVMFRSPAALAGIYPSLVRGGIVAFDSPQVMRFLGKKITGMFRGEVTSDYRRRPEGVRLKHQLKANSIKVYDKQGSVLRVETTINQPRDFKVFRRKEGQRRGPLSWQRMRKGVADLHRRAKVSQQANERYLEALASIDTDRPLRELIETVCRPRRWKGRRVRALRPWSSEDRTLLEAVNRGEFALGGLRNRDLVALLFPESLASKDHKRRIANRITRKLRLLRAHGLIKKITHTHRYTLTRKGRQLTTAVLLTQDLTMKQVKDAVA